MKSAILITLAILCAGHCLAQLSPAPAPAGRPAFPRIQFAEPVHDFGKIPHSSPYRHEFIFTNTGAAALEITAVRASCQCTTPGTWDKRVEPGRTGKIPIEFNPANFNGPVSKQVATITCNDPTQNVVYLSLKGTVTRPITIEPTHASFVAIEGETTNETKKILIVSNLEEPLTLEEPQCSNAAFKTDLKTLVPGKQFELQVTYAPAPTNIPAQAMIAIRTSATNMPLINVSAFGMVHPALMAMPPQVRISAPPLPVNFQQPIAIRNNSSTPIKLTEATVNSEEVTVQTIETQPGKLFTLRLGFPTNFQARAGQPLELTVKTTHERVAVLRIPILQNPSPRPVIAAPAPASPAKSE